MTNRQKEIKGYVVAGLLIFAFWADSVYRPLTNIYSEEMEYKTGKPWVMDLKGNPIKDTK